MNFADMYMNSIKDTENITDDIILKNAEKLFSTEFISSFNSTDFESVKQIHIILFSSVYPDAGALRKHTYDNSQYPAMYLSTAIETSDIMYISDFDNIVDKFVYMYNLTPFDYGNDTVFPLWLNLTLYKNLNKYADFSMINKTDYINALNRSKLYSIEMKYFLNKSIKTDDYTIDELIKTIKYLM